MPGSRSTPISSTNLLSSSNNSVAKPGKVAPHPRSFVEEASVIPFDTLDSSASESRSPTSVTSESSKALPSFEPIMTRARKRQIEHISAELKSSMGTSYQNNDRIFSRSSNVERNIAESYPDEVEYNASTYNQKNTNHKKKSEELGWIVATRSKRRKH